MSDEFQQLALKDDQINKLRADNGDGLDSTAVTKFRAAIATKFSGAWELEHVALDDKIATLRRVRVLTEVSTGVDGVVTVSPQDKTINDGRKFATWADMHHPGLQVLEYNSLTRQGHLGEMASDVARCREAVAQVLSADPWDVPILVTRDKTTGNTVRFDMTLPTYFPSKHLERLTEVATEIVGDYRWTVRVDAQTKNCSLELVPDRLDRPIPWIEEPAILERGIRIGETEHGEPWRVPVLGTHKLVIAETRWGKGSVLWGYVRGLKSAIADGTVVIWAIDLKGGVEVSMGRELFGRVATSHSEAVQMLREARALMDSRLREMGEQRIRQHVPVPGDPALVLIFDEFTALRLAAPDAKARAAAEVELTLLLSQGGAPNVLITAFLQSPKASDVPARDFFPSRLLGRISNRAMCNTILGDMAKENGADATKLPARLKGTFYVASDGGATPIRARAHYSDDDAIREAAASLGDAAERGQQALNVLLTKVMVDDTEDDADEAPVKPRKRSKSANADVSGPPDPGAWMESNREMCSACDSPINPSTGECGPCSF